MRELLFRGKRLKDGAWIEGFYCEFANNKSGEQEYFIQTVKSDGRIDTLYHVDPSTVGQYTGLTDKNGKRIFEGDIIPVWEQGEEYPYKVVYCGDCFMLSMLDSEQGSYPLSVKCNASEVIGNIHDNPELMEGGKDNVCNRL